MRRMAIIITEPDATASLRLLSWFSPAFPTGSFSYSHGLEWVVETGDVRDRATLVDWLADVVVHGALWCDGLFFCAAHRAAVPTFDPPSLLETAELAAAFRGTSELALEASAQGRAFLTGILAGWPHPLLEEARDLLAADSLTPALPWSAGVACGVHGIPLDQGLLAFAHASVATLVNAGVRLVPLGQSDGLLALAALEPLVRSTVERACAAGLDDLGSAALGVDLASMAHETQYTRLFRS